MSKHVIYHLGDKFLVNNLETRVVYINNGMAWVAPADGDMTHAVCDKLDEKGFTTKGVRAVAIVNRECGAV